MLVAFPLISFISLKLKIRMPEYLSRLYCTNLNTLFITKPLISCYWDSLKGFPGIIIMPSCLSFIDSSLLACFLFIIKAIEVLIPLLITVMNCSSKSLSIGHLRLWLPLWIVVVGQILLCDPDGHP